MAAIDASTVAAKPRNQSHFAALGAKEFQKTRIPKHGIALLGALRFSSPECELLEQLDTSEWNRLLALCDAGQLTLLLGHLCRPFLPDWVRARIDRNCSDNAHRFGRLQAAAFEISDALNERSIEFALLKGFAHSPDLSPDPLLRAQGDIDLWCLPDQVFEARDALSDLGYRPACKSKGRHLDPMIRETDWEWRGDYFARDLPIPVDLHYCLWDAEMEHIPGPPEKELWQRRVRVEMDGHFIPTLDPVDALSFAALHVMMHLFHGDLRLERVWELAYALSNRSPDDEFWLPWQSRHSAESRQLQLIPLLLADQWFGCGLPDLIREKTEEMSPDVMLWVRKYGLSPVEALFLPNKDELWLNLCFLRSLRDKALVFSRRLLPLGAAVITLGENRPSAREAKQRTQRSRFSLQRVRHHVRAIPSTCVGALKWWWLRQELGSNFWTFLLASVLFDFGEFIFFLLYNLYLLDLGHTEKFLGQLAAAVTAGTFAAILPAAAVTRRVGLRNAVIIAIVGTALATTLRASLPWQPTLLFTAFLNGLFMSFWAVSLPPAVAGLTNGRNRTLGFSLITSLGIGMGALGGFAGGRLPGLLIHLNSAITPLQSKRFALLLGSAFAALAIIPAALIEFPDIKPREAAKRVYPRGRFVYAFLIALFVWSLGTGGFNPFFNVYFSRRFHASVESIGSIFSYGQLAQVFVILLAPAVLKRMGDIRGIVFMQLATAAMLASLALVSSPLFAAFTYVAYMCFQYMSEPALLSMLMTRVAPSEQSGASALNFMVISLAGIVSAMIAGAMISHGGYGPTLSACAIVTVIAAALFYGLVRW